MGSRSFFFFFASISTIAFIYIARAEWNFHNRLADFGGFSKKDLPKLQSRSRIEYRRLCKNMSLGVY